MNELEELKARTVARKKEMEWYDAHTSVSPLQNYEAAEADLDRAIAIAERYENGEALEREIVRARRERDEAITAAETTQNAHVRLMQESAELIEQRDKAIAAAKALRDQLQRGYPKGLPRGNHDKVLADTAWLDDNEPNREVDRRETLGDGHS